jgi:hypothetical protein
MRDGLDPGGSLLGGSMRPVTNAPADARIAMGLRESCDSLRNTVTLPAHLPLVPCVVATPTARISGHLLKMLYDRLMPLSKGALGLIFADYFLLRLGYSASHCRRQLKPTV